MCPLLHMLSWYPDWKICAFLVGTHDSSQSCACTMMKHFPYIFWVLCFLSFFKVRLRLLNSVRCLLGGIDLAHRSLENPMLKLSRLAAEEQKTGFDKSKAWVRHLHHTLSQPQVKPTHVQHLIKLWLRSASCFLSSLGRFAVHELVRTCYIVWGFIPFIFSSIHALTERTALKVRLESLEEQAFL